MKRQIPPLPATGQHNQHSWAHTHITHITSIKQWVVRVLVAGGATCLLLFAVVVGATVLQATRDETRSADVALIFAAQTPTQAHVQHAISLYQEGYTKKFVAVAPEPSVFQEWLVEGGIPQEAVVVVQAAGEWYADVEQGVQVAYQQGGPRMLIVDTPTALLRLLKIAHDYGVDAYGSPAPIKDMNIQTVVQASVGYWEYVLMHGRLHLHPPPATFTPQR